MKTLRTAVNFMTAIGAGMSVFIADTWKMFAVQNHVSFAARAAGQLLIVGIGAHVIKELATVAVGSWPWLRRALLGRHYFEGTWCDVVSISNQAPIYGISWIEPDGMSVKWFAFNHSAALSPCGFFIADLISVEWPRLFFKYKVSDDSSVEAEGFGQLMFDVNQGGAAYYHGFCVDRHGSISTIFGSRITDQETLSQLIALKGRKEALGHAASQIADMMNLSGTSVQKTGAQPKA